MRLLKVEHTRCGEAAGHTYVWIDDDVDALAVVDAAKRDYLRAIADLAAQRKPPNDYRPYGSPPYDKFPDKTVAEVKAEWEAKKVEWTAWNEKRMGARLAFEDFLARQEGVKTWAWHESEVVALDWGHLHGTSIDYSLTDVDTIPRPDEVLGLAEDEDEYRF
jgi:hypothetical protein